MPPQPVPTICPYCGVGCALTTIVEDGRAVGIEYVPEHPASEGALCPKGNAALEVLDHPDRLRYPMKRTAGGWTRISWDEALALVADNLASTRQEHGANALGFLASAKCTNEENYALQKLARLMGTNNVDHCARLCHASTIVGLSRAFGGAAMTNPLSDLARADCILIIGSNLSENHAPAARWIWRAKDRGARVIVADPRFTPTAWLADTFLQLRPGTDVALLNGLAHVILREGLADRDFIAQRTIGFDALARTATAYSPEVVAAITGVPAERILAAARAYGRAPAAAIVYCMGITQHTTGSDNVAAIANLALICGQVGRPGTGVLPLRGQNNVQGACDMGALAEFLPGYRRVEAPGLTVVEMMYAAAAGDLRAMLVMGENPVVSDPNADHVLAALEKLDFLAVQDVFLTETAELAHVVLPAAAWAEKEGSYTSTERRVQWSHRVTDPAEEARPDLWIVAQIARRLGFDFADDPRAVLREINAAVPAYAGITPERLTEPGRVGGLIWPCPDPAHPGTPILHVDAFDNTPDGRGHIIPVEYRPPAESPGDAYPLVLTTGRVVVHYNSGSMSRRSASLLAHEPALFVEVHPADAQRLGLTEGAAVEVASARGKTTAQARITNTIAEGWAFMPFHFAGTNVLTSDALDPLARIPEFKVAACAIEAVPPGGER